MKFAYLLIVFFSLGLTSCVKEYTCECKMTYSGEPGLPEPTFRSYKLSNTYETAKKECEAKSGTYQEGNVKTVEECALY